jgi:uncharacterized protein
MSTDWQELWKFVVAQFPCGSDSIHGPEHWRRVERNGVWLATSTGADLVVVRLFALFHDSRRVNEYVDDGHGLRGANLAGQLRGKFYELPDSAFDKLEYACIWHTESIHHDDPTIGTCWDADRLDLGRVGTLPDPSFMSTNAGKHAARHGLTPHAS